MGKIIFLIFKSKYRKVALNNFLYSKKIGPYRIVNLSGVILSYIGYLIYKLDISKNFKFISCDGSPFLKNEQNAMNIWFGGTNYKLSDDLISMGLDEYKLHKNNFLVAASIFTERQKFIQFYPCNLIEKVKFNNPKIVIALKITHTSSEEVKLIWENKKTLLTENLSLIDNEKFWDFVKGDNEKKQKIYIGIKNLLRIHLVKKIKEKFKHKCILVGTEWKSIFEDSLESNFDPNFIKKIYRGNICVDFLPKDGDEVLNTRSIGIIESGGILIQVRNFNSDIFFPELSNLITFNTEKELLNLLEKKLSSHDLGNLYQIFLDKYKKNFNEKTCEKIFTIGY
jgi:hypothetical protein